MVGPNGASVARYFWLLLFLLTLAAPVCADESAAAPKTPDAALAQQINALFDTAEFRAGFQGVLISSLADGRTLYERNADRLFLPASNSKLLTSGAALALLGRNFRYHTRLLATGKLDRSGVLHGDLILRGDGDPLFAFDDARKMAQRTRQAGIRRVTGKLYYDESRFDGRRQGDGWTWDDAPYNYAAQISALNLNENVVNVQITAGKRAGAAAQAAVRPNLGYVMLENRATVAGDAAKTEAAPLDCDRLPGTNRIVITGNLPKNARRKFTATVDNPARFCMTYCVFALNQTGVRCKAGGAYRPAQRDSLRTVAQNDSPPLSELLPKMNKPSDNLMAECLLKTIGSVRSGKGTAAAGIAAISVWLKDIGIAQNSVHIADGSGLSRYNFASPRCFVRLLDWLYHSDYRGAFFDSLPLAGVDGTLKNRLKDTAAQGRCRAKTGTMSHVCSLSGIVTTRSGEPLAFSLLMNNHLADAASCRAAQDKIVALLAN